MFYWEIKIHYQIKVFPVGESQIIFLLHLQTNSPEFGQWCGSVGRAVASDA